MHSYDSTFNIGKNWHTGTLTLRQCMRVPLEVYNRQLFQLLVLFLHDNALSRFHGRQGCAVKRRVDPFHYDPSIRVPGGPPAVSWNKADHAYGPVLAVDLEVEADDVLVIHACCGSG